MIGLTRSNVGNSDINGQPRLGIRRAAFVAARNRLTEAVQIIKLTSQLEIHLLQQ